MPADKWHLINTDAIDELYAALPHGQATALIAQFRDEYSKKVGALLTNTDDLREVASIAHKLVSISAGLGMEQLALATRDLMQAATRHTGGDTKITENQWLQFCRLSERSFAELDAYLKTLN